MSLGDAFAPAEAHYHKVIQHQTWGHLFPEGNYFEGKMRIATSVYGDIIVLDEQVPGIDSSPWWYVSFYEFAHEFAKLMKDGEVRDIWISVTKVEYEDEDGNYDHTNLEIQLLKHEIIAGEMEALK